MTLKCQYQHFTQMKMDLMLVLRTFLTDSVRIWLRSRHERKIVIRSCSIAEIKSHQRLKIWWPTMATNILVTIRDSTLLETRTTKRLAFTSLVVKSLLSNKIRTGID